MKRLLLAAFALLAVACGSGEAGAEVASLDGSEPLELATVTTANTEDQLLAFTACMRDEGIDVPDPEVDAEGNVVLGLRGQVQDLGASQEELQAAFAACSELIEGVIQQVAGVDFTELEDQLLEFAACMRDQGIDMPDPDLTAIGPGNAGAGGGPFGDAIDASDPAFQAAAQECQDFLPNVARAGGGAGPGAGGGRGAGAGGNG